jgi:hypothetical protein
MSKCRIIAGPDSLDERNITEAYEIAEYKINGLSTCYGVRTVGLKSRTNFDPGNSPSGFMGHDFEAIMENFDIFGYGGNRDDLIQLPTVKMAQKLFQATGVQCATEIMLPAIQCACIARLFKFDPFMAWIPAVDQLGWHARQIAGFAKEYGWTVGLKNGKWLGEDYVTAESDSFTGKTSIEVVWDGLVDWSSIAPEVVLIHRGCDLPDKGDYRNLPIHNTAKRTKLRNPGTKLLFDPSHSLGPKMREEIVGLTILAMKMMYPDGSYVYDGVMLEVGTSLCDTFQHLSVGEYKKMVKSISEFRELEISPPQLPATYDSSHKSEIR